MYTFFPKPNNMWENWVYFENLFSSEECKKIVEFGHEHEPMNAEVGAERKENNEIRTSVLRWIPWSETSDWIYQRLSDTVNGCNNARYQFNLNGFLEDIQFTQYQPGGHYRWHMDFGHGDFAKRKLSIVAQLSDPEEYEGGNLQFFDGSESTAPRDLGSVIIFPSFMQHRVLPVTEGTRFSLVLWSSGPPFK